MAWLVATAGFYGLLAAAALYATWHHRELWWIGLWLVAGWAASNAIWWTTWRWQVFSVDERAGLYSVIEIMVIAACAGAWRSDRRWPLAAIVAVACVSIAANVALASFKAAPAPVLRFHETVTNICFAAECVLAALLGVQHGRWVGRFARLPPPWWRHPQPDAARRGGEDRG